MSGSTILITPSMDIRNPNVRRRQSPSAVSTDVSDSICAPSMSTDPPQTMMDIYFGPHNSRWQDDRTTSLVGNQSISVAHDPPSSPGNNRVHTRQQSNSDEGDLGRSKRNAERIRHGLMMMPRISNDPIACNKRCYILHPDFPDTVVGEGKSGGSWKCRTQKLGHLCSNGEQMVQVHSVIQGGCKLMHAEERHKFRTLEEALVKTSGSSVYIKWCSRYLVRIVDKT